MFISELLTYFLISGLLLGAQVAGCRFEVAIAILIPISIPTLIPIRCNPNFNSNWSRRVAASLALIGRLPKLVAHAGQVTFGPAARCTFGLGRDNEPAALLCSQRRYVATPANTISLAHNLRLPMAD